MGCTVRELLSRTDSRELSEWLAFFQVEPMEDGYWQAGMLASLMANLWGGGKTSPEDFIPRKQVRRKQSPAEMAAAMGTVAARLQAKSRV